MNGQTGGWMKALANYLLTRLPLMPVNRAGTGASVCVPVCVDIV